MNVVHYFHISRKRNRVRSRSLNKTTTRCARRTTSGQGCNDDRHPVGPGGLLADPGGRRAAGRPQLARQARHAHRLYPDRIHRPVGLADEPDPGVCLYPARVGDHGDRALDSVRRHPDAQHPQTHRRHHRHSRRLYQHLAGPAHPGHHHRLVLRRLYRRGLGLWHPGRHRRAPAGGHRLSGARRRAARHDDPVHPGVVRCGRHPHPGGYQQGAG